MKVCYFGTYDRDYPRNRLLIKGLRKNGVEVIECNDRSPHLLKFLKLSKKHFNLDYDILLAGYLGQYPTLLAKLLTRRPIVLDVINSMYKTYILEYQRARKESLKAKWYHGVDEYSCKFANIVLSDTDEHINYFCNEFHLDRQKFRRVFLGEDEELFYPKKVEKSNEKFRVFFYGTFNRLQGIENIVKAAKLLEGYKDIEFNIVGTGRMYSEIQSLYRRLGIKNMYFNGKWVPFEELPNHFASADIALGIFGDTLQSRQVVPHKVYQGIAMEKPVITRDSPALREILTPGENCLSCPPGDPESLSGAILMLKEDKKLRNKIAQRGYKLFKEKYSTKVVGESLKKILEELM